MGSDSKTFDLVDASPESSPSKYGLDDVASILDVGTGASRQRAVVEAGGTLVDVVHHLVENLADDTIVGTARRA